MSRTQSSGTRAKISAALKGKPKTQGQRAAQSLAMTGRKPGLATRAKMSAARKGQPKSPAHREAIAAALRGRRRPRTGPPSYFSVHSEMGRASEHLCECGAQALDWAYQYTAKVVLFSPEGWPYS